jgi:hypothetical protein
LLAFRHKSTEHSTGRRSSVEEYKRERERRERETRERDRERRRRRRRRVLVPVHRDDEPGY